MLGVTMPDREILARIGYMTQSDGIYVELSVWENLRFFAALSGTRDRQPSTRSLEIVELGIASEHAGAPAVRRHAPPAVAGVRAGPSAVRPLPRRADGGHRSRPPRPVLEPLPRSSPRTGTTLVVSSHVMDEADRCDELLLMLARQGPRPRHRRARSGRRPARRTSKQAFLRLRRRRGREMNAAPHAAPSAAASPTCSGATTARSALVFVAPDRDHGPARLGHPRPGPPQRDVAASLAGDVASARSLVQAARHGAAEPGIRVPRRHPEPRTPRARRCVDGVIDIADRRSSLVDGSPHDQGHDARHQPARRQRSRAVSSAARSRPR